MIVAIVPAAGRSSRMGRPKLILEIAGTPVIGRVIDALREGGIDHVLVVTAPITEPAAAEIARIAVDAGASVVHLDTPTPDMRATIEQGLRHVRSSSNNSPAGIAIVPGDSVGLTSELVAELLTRFRQYPSRILVPFREGKRGHPLFLPWQEALAIEALPPGTGVNALLTNHSEIVDQLDVTVSGHDSDLDTPEDYARWSQS